MAALVAVGAAGGASAVSTAGDAGSAAPPPASVVTATAPDISSGALSSCALTVVGGVRCWGDNLYGALGVGSSVRRSLVAIDVPGLTSGVKAVGIAGNQACALTTAGKVLCWGEGVRSMGSTPTAVPGLASGVRSISVGPSHACAVTAARGVTCWGADNEGQLGDGTVTTGPLILYVPPVHVVGLPDGAMAGVSAGVTHTCAVTLAGATLCWGSNRNGQLGDGSRTDHPRPTPGTTLGSQTLRVSAGSEATCAVTTTHAARCWGTNAVGALGVGDHTDRLVPTAVVGLSSGVTQVTPPSSWHTCAVVSGRAWCWGTGAGYVLGDGVSFSDQPAPVVVQRLGPGVVRVAAATGTTCAVKATGAAWCWGSGGGVLGVGDTFARRLPAKVLGL